jgi:hypothetical protein
MYSDIRRIALMDDLIQLKVTRDQSVSGLDKLLKF